MRLVLFFLLATLSIYGGEQFPEKFEGRFEEFRHRPFELISWFLPNDPVIVHAGGLYGDETMDLARRFPNGKVISFEPNPHAFEILAVKTAKWENIYTYNLALNSYSGNAFFYLCYGSKGDNDAFEAVSSLLKPSEEMKTHYQGPRITVECTTLDDWCKDNNIPRVDFLCLDVRGSELHVLANCPHILKTVKCIYVHTNLFPFRMGMTTYADLKKFLTKAGFNMIFHSYREGLEGNAIFVRNTDDK